MITFAVDKFGQLDILHNNAFGFTPDASARCRWSNFAKASRSD